MTAEGGLGSSNAWIFHWGNHGQMWSIVAVSEPKNAQEPHNK